MRGRRDDCEGCRHRALELVSARTQAQQDHRTRTRGAWSASNRPTRRFTRRIIGRVQWCFGIRCALPAAPIPYTFENSRASKEALLGPAYFEFIFFISFHLLRATDFFSFFAYNSADDHEDRRNGSEGRRRRRVTTENGGETVLHQVIVNDL